MASRRVGSALVSGAVHFLLLAVVLGLLRTQQVSSRVEHPSRSPQSKLVWLSTAGVGGGGGGGGETSVKPSRRAESIRTRGLGSREPVDAPVLDAIPLVSPYVLVTGVVDDRAARAEDSAGTGRDGGAGTGKLGGSGRGDGVGLDAGLTRGTGTSIYNVGNGVMAPRLIKRVDPRYTAAAMRARVAGTVLVECIVLPDGTVSNIRVLRSLDGVHGLDEEAIRAVREWRFAPSTRFGQPVAVLVTVEATFAVH